MSSSWSDLSLDLLISIRNKLQNADLSSFRSVCSQWRYASPNPNPCPSYCVRFNNENNIIECTTDKFSTLKKDFFIILPFSLSSPMSFFGSSNGWLIFITHYDETLHLFDPISNRKLIFPPLYPKLQRYYKRVKPNVHNKYCLSLENVVVSPSIDASIAVAGIVKMKDRKYNLLAFCRHAYDDCPKWSFLKEESKGIRDISLAGDGRFYAIGEDCYFYMLNERPPFVKLIKVNLWLPKHILYADSNLAMPKHISDSDSDNSPPAGARRNPIVFYSMKASGETNLNIYGTRMRDNPGGYNIHLEINLAELHVHGNSNNIDVACDASWSQSMGHWGNLTDVFTPSLRENHSMFSVKHRIKMS